MRPVVGKVLAVLLAALTLSVCGPEAARAQIAMPLGLVADATLAASSVCPGATDTPAQVPKPVIAAFGAPSTAVRPGLAASPEVLAPPVATPRPVSLDVVSARAPPRA